MKTISRIIDRFCQKHRGFGIPKLMLYIVIISAMVYIVSGAGTAPIIYYLLFSPAHIMQGQVWRVFTWIFVPLNNNIFFAALMLYFYYFIGSTLEREWGTAKFTIYYLSGIILNIIYGLVIYYVFNLTPYLSAGFINLSMFFACAVLFPDFTVRLFLIIPIKIKWLALANAAFFAFSIVSEILSGHLVTAFLPLIALLNFFIFCGESLLSYIRPYKFSMSKQTINFKKAAKRAKQDLKDKPYRHICAVCGKTDTDYPDLEFRYCSRCNGYHCFCSEHINNHIHFT